MKGKFSSGNYMSCHQFDINLYEQVWNVSAAGGGGG